MKKINQTTKSQEQEIGEKPNELTNLIKSQIKKPEQLIFLEKFISQFFTEDKMVHEADVHGTNETRNSEERIGRPFHLLRTMW